MPRIALLSACVSAEGPESPVRGLVPLDVGAPRAFHRATRSLVCTHTHLSSELREPLPLAPAEPQGRPRPSRLAGWGKGPSCRGEQDVRPALRSGPRERRWALEVRPPGASPMSSRRPSRLCLGYLSCGARTPRVAGGVAVGTARVCAVRRPRSECCWAGVRGPPRSSGAGPERDCSIAAPRAAPADHGASGL